MDRRFDYGQKIVLAVEFARQPRQIDNLPASYARFQRMPIADVVREFSATQGLFARLFGMGKFRKVLDHQMGYWEKAIAAGQHAFVHYAIGSEAEMSAAFARLKGDGFAMLGLYHVEPQSSAYPFGFPTGTVPDHWFLGQERAAGKDSIFWFNFFPAQPYLFETTFAIWAVFQTQRLKGKGECNQLVSADGPVIANGISEFVQVNLNRFTSLAGFFQSARNAGQHTFTVNPGYRWYGMLLHKI